MAAATLQMRALRNAVRRAHGNVATARDRSAALQDLIASVRARFNAELDVISAALAETQGELTQAAIDTAVIEAPPPADRKAKRASGVRASARTADANGAAAAPEEQTLPLGPATQEQRRRGGQDAAANDDTELPLELPRRASR